MTKKADTDDHTQETVALKTNPPGAPMPVSSTTGAPVTAGALTPAVAGMAMTAPAVEGMGLGTKFFFTCIALVAATLGTALAVGAVRANRVAERTIREALDKVPIVFRAYKADLEGRRRAQVRSAADEPGTKALFAPDVSVATRYDSARDLAEVLGAGTVFLFDRESGVLARNDKPEGEGVGQKFGRVKWVAEPLLYGRDTAAAIVDKGALALVAAAAVRSGEGDEAQIDGVLSASYPLGAAEIEALHGITRGAVAFVTNRAKKADDPPEPAVSASSTGLDDAAVLAAITRDPALIQALLVKGEDIGPIDFMVDGRQRLLKATPVRSAGGDVLGAFVVTRSRDEETAAFHEIRNVLLMVGGAALLLTFPLSFALGRRVARPLEQLTRGTIAIREGQLDVKLPEERKDEVGSLARAFRAMVVELKEKRALQDLLEEMGRQAETRPSPAAASAAVAGGLEIGKTFGGRYRILGLLGRGGMGQVYHASDIELDDVVALKVLSSEAFAEQSKALETLKREIRLARKITHQNVVRVHDFAEADGLRFVSMEYVPGTTLRALAQRRRLALGPALQILKQLCRGLGAIHQAGILHRDLKPENAMVLPNGMVKLMDFGIAEAMETLERSKKTGLVVGTPAYMSPEQLRDEKLDARSDIYAFGVIMYEVLTGVQPFSGKTLNEIVQKIVSVVPEPATSLRPDLPKKLADVIQKCMSKQAAERPASAGVVYQSLITLEVG